MPRKQTHRGPHPQDLTLFAPRQLPRLRQAASDLGWLLDHGYSIRSAGELVGNRYKLTSRQREAVSRSVCSRVAARRRREKELRLAQVRRESLWIDGYNVLTLLESALGGGIVLLGCDRCCRDVAGLHSRYFKVRETVPALELLGRQTRRWGITQCRWLLDRPVSNSGRLRSLLLDVAAEHGWNWSVELDFNPDRTLSATRHVVATSDSVILDRCHRWFNLARRLVFNGVKNARLVDLTRGS